LKYCFCFVAFIIFLLVSFTITHLSEGWWLLPSTSGSHLYRGWRCFLIAIFCRGGSRRLAYITSWHRSTADTPTCHVYPPRHEPTWRHW
jgi:hypothetical protein